MYISKIRLISVRGFVDETIDLSSSEGVKKWLVILGDNGSGKTTILRSIAMGLCDVTGAASLLQDTSGDWISWGKNEATIIIDFWNKRKKFTIKTTIFKTESGGEAVSQLTEPSVDFPWKDIFTCGYGARRSIIGGRSPTTTDPYSPADALYTLFSYEWDLFSPELMFRRYAETKEEQKEICCWLDEVLMLEKGSTKIDFNGISISKNNKKTYLGSLADGHVAIMTLVLDMLGWALLARKKKNKNKLSAIILIDELEQHLHPTWKKYIIKKFHSVFENIQFITTSHSALCAIGTANVNNAVEICSIAYLKQEDSGSKIIDKIPPPYSQRVDQVLTSFLFGLSTVSSDTKREAIHRYAGLQSQKRNNNEEEEFQRLKKYLDQTIGTPESEIEESIAKAVKKVIQDQGNITSEKEQSVNFEILRQVRELIKGE